MIPEMVSLKTAAEKTGLSYNALRLMCNAGQIPSIRIGCGSNSRIKVNLTALRRILNKGDSYEEVFMNKLFFLINKLALWALGFTSAVILILGACAVDSDSSLPFRWVVIGGLGLMATALINEAEVWIWSRR